MHLFIRILLLKDIPVISVEGGVLKCSISSSVHITLDNKIQIRWYTGDMSASIDGTGNTNYTSNSTYESILAESYWSLEINKEARLFIRILKN